MSSVATVMLVDMVGEAGGLELAVLAGGAVLGLQLRVGTGCRASLPLAMLMASAAL